MRIDVICADRGIAPDGTKGASIHLRSIAGALRDAGHDVMLFSSRAPTAPFALPWRPLDTLRDRRERPVPDVVYERLSLGHTEGLAAARDWDAVFALEVNAPLVAEATRYRPDTVAPDHADAERTMLRGADLVFAVSTPLAEWVSTVRDRTVGVHTVWNGIDPARFSPAPVAAHDATLVFLGDPKPWHGSERLIPILQGVRTDRDASLLVIGGGDGASRLVSLAKEAHLEDAIEVTGRVSPDTAARHLARGTIGLAPYPALDPFYFCPLKVLEYMAAGVPTVTTDQGDLRDLVADGGVLLQPDASIEDWVQTITGLLDDAARRRTFGSKARARAHETLSWSAVAARISGLLARQWSESKP